MRRKYSIKAIFIGVILIAFPAFAQLQIADDFASLGAEERISLDLKGMDIIEVLKTLASKGKMNIVVGANVRGRVTMFLKDVDVGEAFEIILAANNLASDIRGEIVYVMTQRDYEQLYGKQYDDKKEAKIIQLKYAKAVNINKALGQIKTKIGKIIVDEGSNTLVMIDAPEALSRAEELVKKIDKPTTTVMFELNYAAGADLKGKIEKILTKGVGEIEVDERTNKILITDLRDRMDELKKIISEFDAKSPQVLIDTKIIEITLTDEFKLGVDWETVITELQETLKKPLSIRSSFSLANAGQLTTGSELLVGNFGSEDYAALVQALKTIGDVNTLSNPRITVLNNEEAKILIGDSEPYAIQTVTQSGDLATTGSELNFLEIGVKLYVTPTINRNGFVTMKIKPEVSNSTRNYTYGDPEVSIPIVSTTQAETSLMVKDGTTIIIAGLIKDNRSDTTSEVPFFGDIPIFGWMFRKTEKALQKKELVMFITPHIVSGDSDYMDVPEYPPMNEDRFTVPEEPIFYRRKPVKMTPEYLHLKKEPYKNLLERLYEERKAAAGDAAAAGAEARTADEKRAPKIREKRAANTGEYFALVKDKILDGLEMDTTDSRVRDGDRVKVYFRLYSGGNLATDPRITESTNEYFADEVIKAVQRSAPFPPFPMSMREFKKDFSLDIVYNSARENRENKQWE
jgi:type II secretory pathway component GspD/PulD (secretin)